MASAPDPRPLTDDELRAEIRRLELEIAALEAQIEPEEAQSKRTRRIARGTLLTAAGFFGLTLDPLSGVIVIVGFFDWIEGFKDDAAAMNLRIKLSRERTHLQERLALIESQVRRRGGNI